MGYKSDIEIAQETTMQPITEIAAKAGIDPKYLEQYGNYKAKIDYNLLRETKGEDGKLILVTAINPTPAGEGKTTTTVGLADGMQKLGKKVMVALREPSLGPVFGVKGGAAGGGYAQVVPMEDINLHFTGDFHAIGAANNLLAAMLDNHIFHAEYVIAREEKAGVHFVADSENPLCKKDELFPEDLAGQPFLLTEKGMSYRRLMDEKLAEKSLEVRPVLELGSTRLISSLVEQNVGISFLPDYVTETKRNEGKLFCVNVKDFEIKLWKQLLYRRDKWVSPPLESVLVYCMEENFSDYGEMKANKS